jgi:hypothetical protein
MYSQDSSSLKRAIQGLPTTDLVRLAEPHSYSTSSLQNRSTTSLMHEVNNNNNNDHDHSYNTSSLQNRSTTSLMREVGPSCSQTSIAISLGQCPKNHVYDADQDSCVSVYSHKFANKALTYALFKANQKK